jgi:hypothetical protein
MILEKSDEEILQSLNINVCPFCGVKCKKVMSHITWIHGIDSKRLKKMLNLKNTATFCARSTREKHRVLAIKNGLGTKIKKIRGECNVSTGGI